MGHVIEHMFLFLVFPGLLFTAAVGFLLQWGDRRLAAMLQWRVGPPPAQPVWDVAKLLGKEVIVPEQAWRRGFLALPFVALSAAALAATLIWSAALQIDVAPVGDLIVVLYVLAIPALAVMLGAACSGNPLGAVGASREMKLILAYELPFVIAIVVAVFQRRTLGEEVVSASTLSLSGLVEFQKEVGAIIARPSGLLAFIVALLCCHAKLGLVPFDMAEAECEIGEGAHIEFSGALLGLLRLTRALLTAALPVLLVTVFWGGMEQSAGGGAVFLLKVLLIVVIHVLIRSTSPRVRIDQAMRFFWGPATLLALIALLLAGSGA